MPNDFYQEDEAHRILRLAAEREVQSGNGMTQADLLRAAGELGISPDAVLAAEAQYRSEQEAAASALTTSVEEASRAREFKKRQRAEYLQRLLSMGGTSMLLLGIWYFTGAGFFWPIFPLLAFVSGLLAEIPSHFIESSEGYQRSRRRWLKRRDRRLAKDEST